MLSEKTPARSDLENTLLNSSNPLKTSPVTIHDLIPFFKTRPKMILRKVKTFPIFKLVLLQKT